MNEDKSITKMKNIFTQILEKHPEFLQNERVKHQTINGTCVECGQGKYSFIMHNTVTEKYAGTIRELLTHKPCTCGSYLWIVSIPPKTSRIDNVIGD